MSGFQEVLCSMELVNWLVSNERAGEERRSSRFFRIVANYLPNFLASHPRKR